MRAAGQYLRQLGVDARYNGGGGGDTSAHAEREAIRDARRVTDSQKGQDVTLDRVDSSDRVNIRQAVLSDLDELALLFNEFREFQGKEPDLAGARQFLLERFNHAESVLFIAQVDGAPAGFAQLYPSFSSTAMARVFILNDLYVRDTGRRQGVASRLLAAVENFAWAFGAVRVTLNVARTNTSGQALYEARGWQQDQEFYMYHRFGPPAV